MACEFLGLSPRTVQRWQGSGSNEDRRKGPKTPPSNRLSEKERKHLLGVLRSAEFCDLPPSQIVPALADRGIYLASEATCYRLLREVKEQNHREPSKPRTHKAPPPRTATGPGQIWTWDITYLRGPVKGSFYYLYLILDIWSRKIVGACVHDRECNELASALFQDAVMSENADPSRLVLHSDNGGPMKGATMLATLQKLGVVASFSRPRVSDDNPYSESIFRTLKYRPEYPRGCFESLAAARRWVDGFIAWYNNSHQHSALRFVTPAARHDGREEEILKQREAVYAAAKQRHPERWSGRTRNWCPVGDVFLHKKETGSMEMKAAA